MTKRKSISPKARFNIFKRDFFTCQYCGATPPKAILHVDHIVPVVDGGKNKEDNLVTSCSQCNFGKVRRDWFNSVKMFIEKLGFYEVLEAMELARAKIIYNDKKVFSYFCGICWNKIREAS